MTWIPIAAAALVLLAVGLIGALRNGFLRRRLMLSLWVALALLALRGAAHLMTLAALAVHRVEVAEELMLVFAGLNLLVSLLNPWFREGPRDKLPSILQDTLVITGFAGAALLLIPWQQALFTSTVAAAVIGFALQDTLGNAFAGLAIQIDRPYRVGNWISVDSLVGVVIEITWRATKMRTIDGNLVVLPNSAMAKEAITNYSAPVVPTRLFVEVGCTYLAPPNAVRDALLAAMRRVHSVLVEPPPDVIVQDFGASAVIYHARFWILDYALEAPIRGEVRSAIWYELKRRGIEIPWPITVLYPRREAPADSPERRDRFVRAIGAVPPLAGLGEEAHRAIASGVREHLYATGEAIVREGDEGASMFVIERGTAIVTVGPAAARLAVLTPGSYFGELSLLTGAPRSATVTAESDCAVIEIGAGDFRAYIGAHPEALEQIARVAAARREERDAARSAAVAVADDAPASLLDRMRKFFGM